MFTANGKRQIQNRNRANKNKLKQSKTTVIDKTNAKLLILGSKSKWAVKQTLRENLVMHVVQIQNSKF